MLIVRSKCCGSARRCQLQRREEAPLGLLLSDPELYAILQSNLAKVRSRLCSDKGYPRCQCKLPTLFSGRGICVDYDILLVSCSGHARRRSIHRCSKSPDAFHSLVEEAARVPFGPCRISTLPKLFCHDHNRGTIKL